MWSVVLRFSGYCSVLLGVKYSFMVVFIPIARVFKPAAIPPKYELLDILLFFVYLLRNNRSFKL